MLRILSVKSFFKHAEQQDLAAQCNKTRVMLSRCIGSPTVAHNMRSYHGTSRAETLPDRHGTTIVCVRKNGKVCMMGDGMVSQGPMIVKPNVVKIRRIPSKDRTVSINTNQLSFFVVSLILFDHDYLLLGRQWGNYRGFCGYYS